MAAPKWRMHDGYKPALDGLRAVAVLAVMAFHADLSWPRAGDLGVDVFFVLSGFLITSLLLGELEANGAVRFGLFYLRRAYRLFPALVTVVVACGLYGLTGSNATHKATLNGVPTALLYITDWTRALHLWDSGLLEHTWSLAIEEQFYLLWPVALIFVVRRWGFRAGGWLAAGLIVASASDCTILWATGASVARTSAGLDVRVDVLMVGCALGVAATAGWLPEGIRRAGASLAMAGAVAVVAVMTVAKYDQGWLATPGLTVFAAAVGWVILGVVVDPHSSLAKLLAHPVLTHIGRISYGLYLWHYPVFGLGLPQLRSLPHPLAALVVFVTAFAAAELSHRVVERPFLDRKRRFEAGRLPDTTPLPVPNGALQRVGNDGAFGPRG